MNQAQTIANLKSIGYSVAFKGPSYAVLTKPFKDMHIGQVVFKDGTIKTMQSTDATRAINNEEINMSKYYTKKMINELTEKERTALYNERTGKSVARMRNKAKAVDAILETNPKLALEDSEQHKNAVAMEEQEAIKVSQRNADPAPYNPDDRVDLKSEDGEYVWEGKSIKSKVRQVLERELRTDNPYAHTLDDLCDKTGGTPSTVRTAISDLRSEKYAGEGGKLNIVKTKVEGADPSYIIQL